MKNPRIVGIAGRRHSIALPPGIGFKTSVFGIFLQIERRIRHDIIKLEFLMLVIGECRHGSIAQMVGDASDSQVHLRKTIGCRFWFLPIHIDGFRISAVSLYELCSLNKHTSRTTTRVIDSPIKRFNKWGDKLYDRVWRIKFSFLFICVDGKSLQKILIYTSYKVVVIEFLWVYLVYFIHYAFQNSWFKGCFRENLLRKSILQFRFVVVQSFYSRIESDSHTGRRCENQLVPKCFIC